MFVLWFVIRRVDYYFLYKLNFIFIENLNLRKIEIIDEWKLVMNLSLIFVKSDDLGVFIDFFVFYLKEIFVEDISKDDMDKGEGEKEEKVILYSKN